MLRLSIFVLVMLQLAGCAGVMHGNAQMVHVTTVCRQQVVPAACVARNDRGEWHFKTPGGIEVGKDFSNLDIACKSPYFPEVVVSVPPMVNWSVAGNVLAGGVIGAGVDVYTGAGFLYNNVVRIAYPACL